MTNISLIQLKSTGFYPDTTIRNMLANAAGPPDYPRSICAQFDGVKARAKRTKKQQQVTVAVNSMLSRLRPRKKPAGALSS